jgi:hypothetical protein
MAKSTEALLTPRTRVEDVVLTGPERKWRALFFEQQTDNGHKRMRSGRAHERGGREREREREREHICPNERAQSCKLYLPESLAKFRVPNLAGLGLVSPGSDRT